MPSRSLSDIIQDIYDSFQRGHQTAPFGRGDDTSSFFSSWHPNRNKKWDGIHPAAAVMEHQANMPVAARRVLAEANLDMSGIDGIAFTRGPGMGICLSVACNAAKTLAAVTGKPLVGVHHMQAHALTPFLTSWPDIPTFPFLSLLISDESIGRTFDKVTRELGLGWAGPSLEKFFNQDIESKTPRDFTSFSNAMPGEMGFSYSGYHSQVEHFVHRRGGVGNIAPEEKVAVARAFQEAVVDHLELKLMLGIKQCFRDNIPVKYVIIGGGVASHSYLRARLTQMLNNPPVNGRLTLQYPPPSLCTDSAVMVAWASMHRFLASDHDEFILSPSGAIESAGYANLIFKPQRSVKGSYRLVKPRYYKELANSLGLWVLVQLSVDYLPFARAKSAFVNHDDQHQPWPLLHRFWCQFEARLMELQAAVIQIYAIAAAGVKGNPE
ncbi:hypothetical protein ARMGADRAFT_1070493 [Armillaria gallica]|uniref:N(6)-L-threonylcarbamoyladenine synthase n=1 Tax=Armillaria gallica TaxID=47427 RepID=A0A2H3ECI1_ARMGA|nr:hypothetical protein ARMGADRAFT_1070493 [Armillaria gallica]